MTTRSESRNRIGMRRIALVLAALALIAMGALTVSCGSRNDKPAETPAPSSVSPTEKGLRTNVTRAPISAAPQGGGGSGNAAVPCGFGPSGGAMCGNN